MRTGREIRLDPHLMWQGNSFQKLQSPSVQSGQRKRDRKMDIISLLIVLVILGVALYLIETYIPMSPPIKTILRVVVVLFIVIWLLRFLGIGTSLRLR